MAQRTKGLAERTPLMRRVACFGVEFAVRCCSARVLRRMLEHLPHTARVTGEGGGEGLRTYAVTGPVDGVYRLYADRRKISGPKRLSAVLEKLHADAMIHVAERAEEFVFVHAGVVGHRGRAVLLPGPSFAGKSSLTAALVRAGATYYSDEYALLDAKGRVHPFARDLQIRRAGGTRQRSVTVQELSGEEGVEPLRVGQVCFARYRRGAAWLPESVTPGMAALKMLPHTIPVRRTPARVMETLAKVTLGAAACESPRGDADETARMILAVMESGL